MLSSQSSFGQAPKRKHDIAFKQHESKKESERDPLFWGPYLAERQWGTIREDYSGDGSCWEYLTYEDATQRQYSYGEDGLLGVCDKSGTLCASLALWNGKDPILKERFFGLTGTEGNHGEDVKELYFYLDNTPTHNYMQALYKYPQNEFPYSELRNHGRSHEEPELEILDTDVFDNNQYWDVTVEYAKSSNQNITCKYTVQNQSSRNAELHFIPQFYFRNTWSKPIPGEDSQVVPFFQYESLKEVDVVCEIGMYHINFMHSSNVTFKKVLITNNNSKEPQTSNDSGSRSALGQIEESNQRAKDAFHLAVINDADLDTFNSRTGTKLGAWMRIEVPANGTACVYWQMLPSESVGCCTIQQLEKIIKTQQNKANDFYKTVIPRGLTKDQQNICRQAIAGLMWSKQFYLYNVEQKNKEMLEVNGEANSNPSKDQLMWNHLKCHDILLMPDKWEFPWFAAWDLAFHCVQYARFDTAFASEQLQLLLSERYMHPNGQIPGCEFDLGDPNPPIIAWAVWKVYCLGQKKDRSFLNACFNKLIISFQWWHQLDPTSRYLYGNGFMGLDNISVFDRSKLPDAVKSLKQADATGWVAFSAFYMLEIALELCYYDSLFTDMAIKYLRHFLYMAKAINYSIEDGGLWHDSDKFYYDVYQPGNSALCIRSWSGIVPMLACGTINLRQSPLVKSFLFKLDGSFSPYVCKLGEDEFFLTLMPYVKLKASLLHVFSEKEFLSPFGIRSLSKVYESSPYNISVGDQNLTLTYQPGESTSNMFGGNSNWRGPIWLCMNFLFVECLEKYSSLEKVFTSPLSVQYPTGQGQRKTFKAVAQNLCQRMVHLYQQGENGTRPIFGDQMQFAKDGEWQNLILFYEYHNADTGKGCGASHQTGWSALVFELLLKLSASGACK